MIKKTLAAIAIVAAVIVLAEPALARVDVKIDFDKTFNFTAVRTWRFDPAGNGEVKMARTQKDNPDAVKAVAEPIIVESVNSRDAAPQAADIGHARFDRALLPAPVHRPDRSDDGAIPAGHHGRGPCRRSSRARSRSR
jgi:hypothetical protein